MNKIFGAVHEFLEKFWDITLLLMLTIVLNLGRGERDKNLWTLHTYATHTYLALSTKYSRDSFNIPTFPCAVAASFWAFNEAAMLNSSQPLVSLHDTTTIHTTTIHKYKP